MKFVALALTILFVAGSQARFLQADAPPPSQLAHVRAAVAVYLTQVKETAEKAIAHLDDTEYKDYKERLTTSLDVIQGYISSASQTLAPYTDAFSGQFLESTKAMREKIVADVQALRKDLDPKREELREVIQKHLTEYREKLDPVVQEYIAKHKEEMDALKLKLGPVIEDIRSSIPGNLEETKSKLVPLIDAIRDKLTEHLQDLKALAAPYVEEYKEHLTKAMASPQVEDLQGKIGPISEDLKAKLMALWETISQPSSA